MAKNLNVNLTFTANTQQAKIQLQQLQSQLNNIVNSSTQSTAMSGITKEIQSGINAAAQLKAALQGAINPDTGNLNLSQFNNSLKASGMTLSDYGKRLNALGPAGQEAFMQMTRSIASAQVPLRATNTLLDKMWTTMANTMRWQISSSVLQGFTSTIQGAYQYAQDLNESLNNIRIVTNKSVEEMDKFAEKANKAAKALSTTTTAYTDAALIYYQQGLSDTEVEERTNTTIKLANVARESADTVSEWMTAIWNNFDNGSKSLEYYADVVTALGAATASSSDEIATGLEKFAAVADTVGLSYEYATAALATVTATTRQSADVVGTAFKTLFARMQDLKLGETLEDGTTLGQYSEAMLAVGVNIKDATGNLKDMDIILDELGARWKSLDKDQQVALAKSVAGLRQYNQFIALMSNYDYFQENLSVARNSTGELQEQANIYAESWEAASDRVKASAETIYKELLNDDFFIALTNGFNGLLEIISNLLDSMGGLYGFIPLLVVGFNKLFGPQLLNAIGNFNNSLQMSGKEAQELALKTKREALQLSIESPASLNDPVQRARTEGLILESELEQDILSIERQLTDEEQRQLGIQMDAIKMLERENILAAKNKVKAEQNVADIKEKTNFNNLSDIQMSYVNVDLHQAMDAFGTADYDAKIQQMTQSLQNFSTTANITEQEVRELVEAELTLKNATASAATASGNLEVQTEKTKQSFQQLKEIPLSQMYMNWATGLSTFAMGLASLGNVWSIFKNEDMSAGEKFMSVITSLSMALPTLAMGLKTMKDLWGKDTIARTLNAAATWLQAKANNTLQKEQGETAITTEADTKSTNKNTASKVLNKGVSEITDKKGTVRYKDASGKFISKDKAFMSQSKAGWKGIGDAAKNLGGALKGILPTIGLVAAGILIAAGSVALFATYWNKANEEAKKAQKIAEQLAKEYDKAKSKYDELKSTISNYDSTVESMEEMTKGTVEYQEALAKANEEAMKLIDTYGLISGQDYEINKNGLIELTDATKARIQAEELANMQTAQRAKLSGQILASEKQAEADKVKFNRNIAQASGISSDDSAQMWTGLGTGAGIGLAIGTAIAGPVGAAVGAVIGGVVGAAAGTIAAAVTNDEDDVEKQALAKLQEAYAKEIEAGRDGNVIFADLEKTLKELGITDQSLIDSLVENKKATQELIQELYANTEAINLQKQQAMDSYLQGSAIYAQSEYQEQISTTLSQSDVYNEAYEKATEAANDVWDSYNDAALHENYAKLMGYDLDEVEFKNESGKAKVVNKNTGEQIEVIEDTAMREALAQEYARSEAAKLLEGTQKAYANAANMAQLAAESAGLSEDLTDELSEFVLGFHSGSSGNLAMATKEQIDALRTSIEEGTFTVSNEQAKAMGYDNAKDYLDTLKTEIENWSEEASESARAAYEKKKFDDAIEEGASAAGVSATQLKNYTKALQENHKALEGNSEAAVAAAVANIKFSKGIESLQSALDENLVVLDKWNEGSFETYEAASAVQSAISEMFGVEVSADYVKENLKELKELADGNTTSLEYLQQQAAKDYIVGLELSDTDTKSFENIIDSVIAQDRTIEIGANLDLGNSIEDLNKMLEAGTITADQVQQAFGAIGYEPDIGWKTVNNPHPSKTTSNVKIGPLTVATVESVTDATMTVPYIKNSTTANSSTGATSGKGVTKTSSKEMLKGAIPSSTDTRAQDKANSYKKADEEIDRYHEINELMDDMSREMDKLSKAKDRAFGADKVKLIEKEIEALEAETKAQDELIRQTEHYLALDKENLSKYGAEFDEVGRITNFDEMYATQINKYNAAVATGNEETIEKAEEDYANFEKYLSQYEDTLNKLEDEQEKRLEQDIEIYEKKLEAIDVSIEVNIELNERQLKNLERLLEDLDDDAFDGAKRIQERTKMIGEQFENIEQYTNGIKDTLKTAGVDDASIQAYLNNEEGALDGYDFDQATIDQLTKYTDGLTDSYDAIKTLRTEIEEEVMTTFEAQREEIEKNGQAFEHAAAMVGHYKNIIDTVGKDRLGLDDAILKDLNDAKDMAAKGDFDIAASQMRTTQAALDEAKTALAGATTDHDKEYWQGVVDDLTSQLREDTEGVAEAWSNYLTTITDSFNENMQNALDTFEDSIAGMNHKSLDALADSFNKEQEIADMYLEDYKKIYELSKLNRNVQNSLETTDNVKAQRALRELQEEINEYQKDGKQMSEYELANLQKKYELRLAEIALEEAQNAKSVVRLQRDSEGNYGYVYTADQSKIDDSAQKYEDALYAMQENNDNYLEKLQSDIIANRQAMVEELRNLDISDYANAEEYYAARDKIINTYKEKEQIMLDQLGIVLGNNKTLYDNDWSAYSIATGYKISSNEEWETDFANTQLAMQTGYSKIEGFAQGLVTALGSATDGTGLIGQMNANYADWEQKFDTIMGEANKVLTGFSGAASNAFINGEGSAKNSAEAFRDALLTSLYGEGGTKDKPTGGVVGGMNKTTESIGEVENKAKTSFAATVGEATNFQSNYSKKINDAKRDTDNLNSSLNKLIEKKTTTVSVKTDEFVKDTQTKIDNIVKSLDKIIDKEVTIKINYEENGNTNNSIKLKTNGNNTVTGGAGFQGTKQSGGITLYKVNDKYYQAKDILSDNIDNLVIGQNVQLAENAKGFYEGTETMIQTGTLNYTQFDKYYAKKGTVSVPKGNNPFYLDSSQGGKSKHKSNRTTKQINGEYYVQSNGNKDNWYKVSELGSYIDTTDTTKYFITSQPIYKFITLDTGGYTGSWGPEGRLAMLHQKEIVLNAHDTENLLTAVDLVRSMATKLEANALATRQGLAGFASAITPTYGGDILEQNVRIEASFPNATDRNEIEAAFGDLVNLAAQYANRK